MYVARFILPRIFHGSLSWLQGRGPSCTTGASMRRRAARLPARRKYSQAMACKMCAKFHAGRLHSQPSTSIIDASYTSQSPQRHTPPSTQHQRPRSSFLTYFASTTPDTTSKRARLKALFALQALSGYDAETVKSQIVDSGFDKVLGLEVALLD